MALHLPTWRLRRGSPSPRSHEPARISAPSAAPPRTSMPGRSSSNPSTKLRKPESPILRPFAEQDTRQVAMLWQKCFRGTTAPPSILVEQHFRDIFLEHPWFDPELAPL